MSNLKILALVICFSIVMICFSGCGDKIDDNYDETASDADKRATIYKSLATTWSSPKDVQVDFWDDILTGNEIYECINYFFGEDLSSSFKEAVSDFNELTDPWSKRQSFFQDIFGPFAHENIIERKYVLDDPYYTEEMLKDDLFKFYDKYDFSKKDKAVISDDFRVSYEKYPDHIVYELEFMHFLISEEQIARNSGNGEKADNILEDQRKFYENHLSKWLIGDSSSFTVKSLTYMNDEIEAGNKPTVCDELYYQVLLVMKELLESEPARFDALSASSSGFEISGYRETEVTDSESTIEINDDCVDNFMGLGIADKSGTTVGLTSSSSIPLEAEDSLKAPTEDVSSVAIESEIENINQGEYTEKRIESDTQITHLTVPENLEFLSVSIVSIGGSEDLQILLYDPIGRLKGSSTLTSGKSSILLSSTDIDPIDSGTWTIIVYKNSGSYARYIISTGDLFSLYTTPILPAKGADFQLHVLGINPYWLNQESIEGKINLDLASGITGESEKLIQINSGDTKDIVFFLHAVESGSKNIEVNTESGLYSYSQNVDVNIGVASPVDLIFVIDTTGSMYDDIASVKDSATEIVNALDSKSGDYRVAVVDYRDYPVSPYGVPGTDYVYKLDLSFSSDKDAIISSINSLSLGNGYDWEESVYSALVNAIIDPNKDLSNSDNYGWRKGVCKYIILMGDAPPHIPEPWDGGYSLDDVVYWSENVDPVIVYSIRIGADDTTLNSFSKISESTGGKVYTAVTASDLVDTIVEVIEAMDTTPPAIISVSLNNYNPLLGESILVIVDTFDNVGVISVEACGVPLTCSGGTIWEGTIVAVEGAHTVDVSACDAAGNNCIDESSSYTATSNNAVNVPTGYLPLTVGVVGLGFILFLRRKQE